MKIRKTFEIKANTNQLEVGDIISFKLKVGEKVEAMAVKREDGKMLMHFVDCLKEENPMNETNTNEGGYEESDIRKVLNTEIIDRFPDKITERIIADENGDSLFLLSIEEVLGLDNEFSEAEGQLEVYKTPKSRIKTLGKGGWPTWYWLRSPDGSNATSFCSVSGIGNADYTRASYAFGLAPAFYFKIS